MCLADVTHEEICAPAHSQLSLQHADFLKPLLLLLLRPIHGLGADHGLPEAPQLVILARFHQCFCQRLVPLASIGPIGPMFNNQVQLPQRLAAEIGLGWVGLGWVGLGCRMKPPRSGESPIQVKLSQASNTYLPCCWTWPVEWLLNRGAREARSRWVQVGPAHQSASPSIPNPAFAAPNPAFAAFPTRCMTYCTSHGSSPTGAI